MYGRFTVFADGFYRYPDNQDFRQNTIISCFRSLQNYWFNKDWPATVTLIDEIYLLEILQDEDRNSVRRILMEWQRYLQMSGSR